MSKHHFICKSKTLDVPIIITSQNWDSNDTTLNDSENNNLLSKTRLNDHEQSNPLISQITNKFKLDQGLSLDSHYLKSQNSSSSSSASNGFSSSSNSMSYSNNSIQKFQYVDQNFLVPPPTVNLSLSQSYNINADFEIDLFPKIHHDTRIPNYKLN